MIRRLWRERHRAGCSGNVVDGVAPETSGSRGLFRRKPSYDEDDGNQCCVKNREDDIRRSLRENIEGHIAPENPPAWNCARDGRCQQHSECEDQNAELTNARSALAQHPRPGHAD